MSPVHQAVEVLEQPLTVFDQRKRTNANAIMASIASQLTALEINAVVPYVNALQ